MRAQYVSKRSWATCVAQGSGLQAEKDNQVHMKATMWRVWLEKEVNSHLKWENSQDLSINEGKEVGGTQITERHRQTGSCWDGGGGTGDSQVEIPHQKVDTTD